MNPNQNDEKWRFKLQLYNQDEQIARKHYKNDAFCHKYCITGRCTSTTQTQCQLDHNIPILLNAIAKGKSHPDTLNFCRVLTNYFSYIYISNKKNNSNDDDTNCNSNPHVGDEYVYIPFIKSCLGSFAAIDGKIALSRQYFDSAIKLAIEKKKNGVFCGRDTGSIFFNYARALSQHFNNWDKAEKMYKAAIKEWPDRGPFHCKYAKELVYQNRYELAHHHFNMALKYSQNKFATQRVEGLLRQMAPRLSSNLSNDNIANDSYKFGKSNIEFDTTAQKIAIGIQKTEINSNSKFDEIDKNFCHTFCILGKCLHSEIRDTDNKNNKSESHIQCKFNHLKQNTIQQMVLNQQFDKALKYCQYLLKYYQHENVTDAHDKNNLDSVSNHEISMLKSRLFGYLGDIYNFGCQNDSDIFQSITYYEQSHKLDTKELNDKKTQQCHQLARLYDEKLNNWIKGEYYYLYCIEKESNNSFYHYTYAMSLKNRKTFEKSCKYFENALSIRPNHVRYLNEYCVSLYHLGPKYYGKCLNIAKQTLKLTTMENFKVKNTLEALITKIGMSSKQKHSNNDKEVTTNTTNNNNNNDNGCDLIAANLSSLVNIGVSCKIEANLLYINYKNKLLIEEFERFWNNLAFMEPFKSKYHTFFVENKLNNILCLLFFVDDNYKCLLHEKLKMNKVHKKYFIKQIKLWIIKCQEFEMWLKYMPFDSSSGCNNSDEYLHRFRTKGILTMQSFCFHIKSFQNLKEIIQHDSNCKIIWNRLLNHGLCICHK